MNILQSITRRAAIEAADRILGDEGLGKSTFADNYPAAYEELKQYRQDMIGSIQSATHTVLHTALRKTLSGKENEI